MNNILLVLMSMCVACSAQAMSIEEAQRRAQSFAESRRIEVQVNSETVPGYQAQSSVPSVDQASIGEAQNTQAIQMIYQGMQNRQDLTVPEALVEREAAIIQEQQSREPSQGCNPQLLDHYAYECDRSAALSTTVSDEQQLASETAQELPFSLFQGEKQQCSVLVSGLQNCCSGSPSHFDGCNETEFELAQARAQEIVHYLGSHCSRRQLGACLRRTHSYCTYSSKLERITAQQLHQQFHQAYGSSRDASCTGFSPEQMEQAQLDRLNLNEYYQDIEDAAQAPAGVDARALTRQTLERVLDARQGGQ